MENDNENEGNVVAMPGVVRENEAKVNITWSGQNGDMPEPVPTDADDGDIKEWITEAVRAGTVPGISADAEADFSDFILDRFTADEARPWNLIQVRPKTPFG